MLERYPDGSDITLLNTYYLYPQKIQQDGKNKWTKDVLALVYRDNQTGKKMVEEIEEPEYTFYKTREDVILENNELFLEKEKLVPVTTKYSCLEKTIAEEIGEEKFYYDNIKSGNRYNNKLLHTHKNIFLSDHNIEDHYRFEFDNRFKNESFTLKKSFFDIEADVINCKGDFVEMGECPVNAVTVINEFEKKMYTLLLRNPENPLIEEFEKSINSELFIELKEFIRDAVGGEKKEIKYGLDQFNYEFMFYDEEINLIADLFKLFNYTQPDFILAWNMAFDMPYLIERLKVLGYKPESIMCHPDFKYPVAKYYVDQRNVNDNAERGDFATISSYSVYMCQMIQFASRRKGQSAFKEFKLDYIGRILTNVRKLDYSHITTRLEELPWKDYKTFVFYNIMDTIVQMCIEKVAGDVDYIFNKCLINNTRYSKGHRQTVYLANRGIKEFYNDGLIMGNNSNKSNEKPGQFPGAFVADPLKLSDKPKMKIGGHTCNIFNNCDDFDYKSLYPSQMREYNMAPNTQIGRIYLERQFEGENPFNNPLYHNGGAYLEDLQSGNFIQFCNRWLNFANYSELYDDIIEFFSLHHLSTFDIDYFDRDGMINPIRVTNGLQVPAIIKYKDDEMIKPIIKCNKKVDYNNLVKNININEVVYYER